jgi:hypothetical protein
MREQTETEICSFTFDGILEKPDSSPFIWRDAVRHRNAVKLLARQLAFKEIGERATLIEIAAHLEKHQIRLTAEAENVIETRFEFADWRFPRRR